MANILSHDKRKTILRMLLEGNSIRSVSRLTGCHKTTIAKVIAMFGDSARNFLDEKLRGLELKHVQVDEMWTFVAKKQARLTVNEKAERGDIGDVYLWLCIDRETKLIPTFALGKRSADNARRLMMDLRSRLVMPAAHASDSHGFQSGGYKPITQISTDGFAGYPEAVDLAFGPHAAFGRLIKEYRNASMPYTPSEIVGTKREVMNGQITEGSICTSHIERQNLTVRTFLRRFTRLSLGFSKKFENLAAAVALYVAYYNFCWRTRHSDDSGKSGKLRPTAAMMAKVTDHLWSFDELYETILHY